MPALAALAASVLVHPAERGRLILLLEAAVADLLYPPPFSQDAFDVLNTLVCDLGYYVQNPVWRRDDRSYYGNVRLRQEVFDALERLAGLGVEIPDLAALDREWEQLDPADRLDEG